MFTYLGNLFWAQPSPVVTPANRRAPSTPISQNIVSILDGTPNPNKPKPLAAVQHQMRPMQDLHGINFHTVVEGDGSCTSAMFPNHVYTPTNHSMDFSTLPLVQDLAHVPVKEPGYRKRRIVAVALGVFASIAAAAAAFSHPYAFAAQALVGGQMALAGIAVALVVVGLALYVLTPPHPKHDPYASINFAHL